MDDAENEVLDWENEDDEQNQPQNDDSRPQSVVDADADDAVSLGDEDEQPRVLEEAKLQSEPVPQIYSADADRDHRDRRDTLNAPQKSDQNSSDRRAPRISGHRRGSSRSSPPPRSQPTLQPPPRLTHALPPKPGLAVVAAAIASPAARGLTQKGSGARTTAGDPHSTNLSSSSPPYHSNKKPSTASEWEARVSSRGDTYYYNTVTYESTWSKPSDYQPSLLDGSDDGRQGAYHVPSSATFRSSPTVSDRAEHDNLNSRKAPRHSRKDGDRHYEPETDAVRQAGHYRNGDGVDIGRSSDSLPMMGVSPVDYAPGPTRRDRNADNSREQKAYPEDDSRRRSRIPNADTYTPAEDARPAPTRRRSSPPPSRGVQLQAPDRPPVAAPRRRPASPSPPTTLPLSRPGPDGYDRRPYEQAPPSATLPKEPRATREVRDERPVEPRRIPIAPVTYARPTNPRYRDNELVPEPSRAPRQGRDEERNHDSMRGVPPRAQELEGYRPPNPVPVNYDDRRSIYPEREEIPPTRQRIGEGSGYRPASPPRQETFVPSAAYTREMVRARDGPEGINSRGPFSDDRGDTTSHQPPRRRRSRSRTPERYPPTVAGPERPSAQSREYYEPPPPPVPTRRENYPARDYPPPSRYADPPPPERQAEYARPPPVDDGRSRGGPASRPVETSEAYRPRPNHPRERAEPPPPPVREVYKEPAIPTGPREMAREPPREPRQDASPAKKRRLEKEAARKMTSGTNAVPLGKNRYLANNESTAPSVAHLPPPPQRYADFPPPEPPSRRERPQERDGGRRGAYEPPPEPVRYPDRQNTTIYETPRRPTPPPQDYATRVSDPHSRPPHMAEPRREPVADYRPGPPRRERVRSLSPPPRVEVRPPAPEPRRQLNGDAERYREPNPPNLSRNVSSSTLAGSGNSWVSEVDRRPSRPGSVTMDVDPRLDRYQPPSDKFRDTLRVSSNGSDLRRDNAPPSSNRSVHPSLPVPPANLPSNPLLSGRDQRPVDPPERSPVTTRWNDRPLPPHIKPDAPLPLVAPRPPLSPTASKKVLSGAEITPPRLRRPSAVIDRKAQDDTAARDRERDRGPDRERMERDRDWDREREKDRSERDTRGVYDRPSSRSQPPPPPGLVGRTGSLLERLEAPGHASSANSIPVGNGTPSLFERMSAPSGTVTPMKRNSEVMGGRMDTDDLYGPTEDPSDIASKRRKKGGARQRRTGGKRN